MEIIQHITSAFQINNNKDLLGSWHVWSSLLSTLHALTRIPWPPWEVADYTNSRLGDTTLAHKVTSQS